jgi:hypothetical protein
MKAAQPTIHHLRPSWDHTNTAYCGAYWSRRLDQAVKKDAPICSDCLRVQLDYFAERLPSAVGGERA